MTRRYVAIAPAIGDHRHHLATTWSPSAGSCAAARPRVDGAVKATNLAELYDAAALDWGPIEARLRTGLSQAPGTGGPDRHTCWLATVNQDGSPHVTGIGATWVDGSLYFETGEATRKGRNLARDARCTLSVATHDFDLVVEGDATRVTEPAIVAAMARRWADDGWPARVDDTGRRRSPPTTALHPPDRPRGLCTDSRPVAPPQSPPWSPAAPRVGTSTPWTVRPMAEASMSRENWCSIQAAACRVSTGGELSVALRSRVIRR